jgi:O-antigen/teichoic acid export membrane protein
VKGFSTKDSKIIPTILRRIRDSSIASRVAAGALWSLGGTVVYRFANLAAFVVVARLIGKEGFGQLGAIQSTIGMLAVFGGLGLGLTATKHVAEFREVDVVRAGRIIALTRIVALSCGSIVAAFLALFANYIAGKVLGHAELEGALQVASVLVLLGSIAGVQIGILSGLEEFSAVAQINVLTGVVCIPAVVSGAWMYGVVGAIGGLVAMQMVGCAIGYVLVRRKLSAHGIVPDYANSIKERAVIWRYSVPALLANLLAAPVYWVGVAMLINSPDGIEEMGIFNAANQWKAVVVFIPTTLSAVVLSMLSNFHGRNDRDRFSQLLWKNVLVTAAVSFLAVLAVACLSDLIMGLYGSRFGSGGSTLIALAFAGAFAAVAGAAGQTIASRGEMWWGFTLNLMWAIVFLGCAVMFSGHGALGLALADLFSYLFHVCVVGLFIYLQRRCSEIEPRNMKGSA